MKNNELIKQVKEQLFPIVSVLNDKDAEIIASLKDELHDTWVKKQIFRTETEIRVSVLSDGTHPTPASKYWQAVREQSVMLDNLILGCFELRRLELKRQKLIKELESTEDEFRKKEIEIDLDENIFHKAKCEEMARDRVREIKLWSEIKSELDNGSFDTKNPNTHQVESLHQTLLNRSQTLSDKSGTAEIMNVLGPLTTMERLKKENALSHEEIKKLKNAE